jgi:S1-C subfamily serine protease
MLDDPDGAADSVVVVHSVVPNTPAAKAGLKMDDIIQSWDGVALHSKAEWVEQVKGSRIGSTVHLTVVRNGLQMEVPITIGNSSRELGGVRKVASRSSISTARSAGSSARSRSTGRK